MAGPVEVAVVTGPHPIGSQQVQNGLAAVAGVAGGVVEEAELLPVPGRFEGGLQPLEFPVEHLLALARLVLLVEPPSGPAQGGLPVEVAVVVENAQGSESFLLEKAVHFRAVSYTHLTLPTT